jgi:glycosyltransferase involved in cell wall biosynthesis
MIGGAEQVFIDILKLMQDRVDASVLLISHTEQKQLMRIKGLAEIYELKRKSKFSILAFIRTFFIIRRADLLHIHLRPTLRYINFVLLFSSSKKPIVFHDHHHVSKIGIINQILMFKLNTLDYYLSVNESVLIWANENWKFKYSGFLLNLPAMENIKIGINLQQLFEGKGFVCVGNIKKSKNQLFAVQLAKSLNEAVAFYGNNQDLVYYNQLSKEEDIKIIEGDNQPSKEFAKFKFGLCTSVSESGPLVILEYFVAGLPFLSYKTGGIADVLYKYVPQYFLENFEINDWIKRYETLNQNYQRIPAGLIERVLDIEFNRDVYANKLLEIYSKCLKSAS